MESFPKATRLNLFSVNSRARCEKVEVVDSVNGAANPRLERTE